MTNGVVIMTENVQRIVASLSELIYQAGQRAESEYCSSNGDPDASDDLLKSMRQRVETLRRIRDEFENEMLRMNVGSGSLNEQRERRLRQIPMFCSPAQLQAVADAHRLLNYVEAETPDRSEETITAVQDQLVRLFPGLHTEQ